MKKYPNLTRFKIEIPIAIMLTEHEIKNMFKNHVTFTGRVEYLHDKFTKYHDMTGLWPIIFTTKEAKHEKA